MPIDGKLRTGDCVRFDGGVYYVRLNGPSSTYLHHSLADALAPKSKGGKCSTHAGAPSTRRLMRVGERVVEPASTAVVLHRSRVVIPLPKNVVKPKSLSERQRFLYVVRNCDLPRDVRDLKIGITHSVRERLRAYQTRNPNDQAIIVVDCDTEPARSLETTLKHHFADFRVDASEVFTVRPHNVRLALKRFGYTAGADNVWRRRLPTR